MSRQARIYCPRCDRMIAYDGTLRPALPPLHGCNKRETITEEIERKLELLSDGYHAYRAMHYRFAQAG